MISIEQPLVAPAPLPDMPLEYRYALDGALALLARVEPRIAASPELIAVRCDQPELAAEIDLRLPVTTGPWVATLWLEPQRNGWQETLGELAARLTPGAPLAIVASTPLARLLPERRSWSGEALGLAAGGLLELRRRLRTAGLRLEAVHGAHSLAAIGLNGLGGLATRAGRPDLGDRLEFAARARYGASGVRAALTTVIVLLARRPLAFGSGNRPWPSGASAVCTPARRALSASAVAPITAASPTAPIGGQIERAVAGLDGWLETMRGPGGYGGPVAHWWQQSLLACGPGRDWRYEGIIAGYLTLWKHSDDPRWLAKARRAGDDLRTGQLPCGSFADSAFERNPASGGTPHEFACALALLELAAALRAHLDEGWAVYADSARRNLTGHALGRLWDERHGYLRDDPQRPAFVPNKAATFAEAVFALAALDRDEALIARYALPTLERILTHQVWGGPLDGAIAQNSFGATVVAKYFPLYVARCVPALLCGFVHTRSERYLAAAIRALGFVLRRADEGGELPTVVYSDGREARRPAWVAPLGEVLRAADALAPYGLRPDLAAIEARLLAGVAPSGGIATATGFAGQGLGRVAALPDLRDLLPVAGWCDKAFRALVTRAQASLPSAVLAVHEADCVFGGRRLRYRETPALIELLAANGPCYRWRKGSPRPELAREEFWIR